MKKYLVLLVFIILTINKSFSCSYYDPDIEYYNLFMQEIIDDPQYYPFLMTLSSAYYASQDSSGYKNENIEEWQQYFGITYNEAYYLVFKAREKEIRDRISGKSNNDNNLHFLTPEFVKKYKQALLYIAYAKYLEPYMLFAHTSSDWNYGGLEKEHSVDKLDYNKVISVLQRSWNAETDKELKLRYGYQLVRFAHYNEKYDEAIRFFNTNVESLNYKPAMYYHALCQKAGAERGLKQMTKAYRDFFTVFIHSKNLKETALTSMRLGESTDYLSILQNAKTIQEKNDAYLLLGFIDFSNPLNEFEKIVAQSPDAIQAKVLMARAINSIERNNLMLYPYFFFYHDDNTESFARIKDKRFPVIGRKEDLAFFQKTLRAAVAMTERTDVKNKNFWYLTAAYLQFLNKDFATASAYLEKVNTASTKYSLQKKNLAMLIDISRNPQITPELETAFYQKYKDVLNAGPQKVSSFEYEADAQNTTQDFVLDVLANRYFLQKDYAKSFLLNNGIDALTNNPQLELVNAIEAFYKKKNKNPLEQYIARSTTKEESGKVMSQLHYIRGVIYLTRGDLANAASSFKQSDVKTEVPSAVFGYNRIESFASSENEVMAEEYRSDFPFIDSTLSPGELVEVLIKLQNQGKQSGELAAKANYLIGNFFYNVSVTGYYRHYLRFDENNGANSAKFNFDKKPDIYDNIYFKYYRNYYDNPVSISEQYLQKSYLQTTNNELKARIAFALSKCEQENFYQKLNLSFTYYGDNSDNVLIKNRQYFKELIKYKNTQFFAEVKNHCKYFDYYVNHFGKN